MELTQERVKQLFHYNPLTGEFTRLITANNNAIAGSVAGSEHSGGYQTIGVDGKPYLSHRLAWLYVYGYLPEYDVDHKDRVKYHNWIDNLREATRSCNMRNTGNRIDNTSGIKGVSISKGRGKWQSNIRVNGKQVNLGRHIDLLEAVCHRLAAEQAEDWEGCDSSSPAYQFVQKSFTEGRK